MISKNEISIVTARVIEICVFNVFKTQISIAWAITRIPDLEKK